MPPAVPLIAVAAGYAASTTLTGVITVGLLNAGIGLSAAAGIAAGTAIAGLGGFAVSTAISVVGSRAFAPGNHQSTPEATAISAQSHAVMVNTTIGTHKIIYGEAKVSGVLQDLGTTNSGPMPHGGPKSGTNLFRHFVVMLAGHEIDSIDTIYLNDKPVTIGSNNFVNTIPYSYYPSSPTASSKTLTSASRANEVVTATTGTPHGFAAGDQVTVTTATDLSMNGDFIILATPSSTTFTYSNGGPNATASGGTAVNNTVSASVNSLARIKKHLGSVGQEADTDMIAEIPGWDSSCRLQGLAYLYIRLEYSQDVFGRGVPNVSAIVRGKKVYDPRDGTTAWTDNSALCARDYMVSDYGINAPADEMNDTYWSASANVCDESVTLTTGGTQKRYTTNGVLDTASSRQSNLDALVAAMAGTVTDVQGQYRGHAGAFESTVGDITTDMLAGRVKVRYNTPRQQLFNGVQGIHVNPSLSWAATDFHPVTNETYTSEDGGEEIFKDIQLPLTNHPEAAQRIGKLILEQARQGICVELPLNHHAMQYAVWDNITYTDPVRGWDHKVFRIKKFSTSGIGPIVLSLQEESSASYDWNNGEATILDAAPDTNLPNPLAKPAVPTGVAFSSRITAATDSVSVYNLVLTWTLHDDAFVVNGGRLELQYKRSADSDWRPSFFVNGEQTTADVLSSSINVSYDLRIRAVSALGSRSDWVTITGAVAGSSGGVGTTNDWGNWTDAVGPTIDCGNWTDATGTTDDWGYYI